MQLRWLAAVAEGGSCSASRSATSTRPVGCIVETSLAAVALQSSSSFLDVEILAKATFLGHLIDEVGRARLINWDR